MAKVVGQLAVAVGTQWDAEARARGLNDPYPLPVSWAPADPSLTDAWEVLVEQARAVPKGQRGRSGAWATSADDLAGAGGDLLKVLEKVPNGRLVVLGEPGAGKTMLMIRLVLDLLSRRRPADPVPILASVASWNPVEQDLWSWLAAQLVIDHPALAAAPPTGNGERTQAAALLAERLILPILDGLDEIPEDVRGSAIRQIRAALRPGEQLVVTCRTEQYRDAVRPPGGKEETLRAAAVQLRPLTVDTVRKYLCHDAPGPDSRARWETVLDELDPEGPGGQALTRPLMVALASAIYNRPGELAGDLRDPAELCDSALSDRAAVESLLFDAFIPAVYLREPTARWTAQDAERWLVFLAGHLESKIPGPGLAWWQLRLAVPGLAVWFGLVIGLAAGLLAGLRFGLLAGLVVGGGCGFMGVFVGYAPGFAKKPSRGVKVRAVGLVVGLGFGLVFGFVAWIVAGLWAAFVTGGEAGESGFIDPTAGAMDGFVAWIVVGLGFGLVAGLVGVPDDLTTAASPRATLARDRQAALLLVLTLGLGFGLVVGLGFGLGFGLLFGLVAGLVAGLGFGLVMSMITAAWPSYMLARVWLALHHRLPWRLVDFLADAHKRGVLRQAGAVYQFRHIELQRRLATRQSNPPASPSASS